MRSVVYLGGGIVIGALALAVFGLHAELVAQKLADLERAHTGARIAPEIDPIPTDPMRVRGVVDPPQIQAQLSELPGPARKDVIVNE